MIENHWIFFERFALMKGDKLILERSQLDNLYGNGNWWKDPKFIRKLLEDYDGRK